MGKIRNLNEAVKRMQQIYEYSFYHGTTEADNQQQPEQDPNATGGGMPQQDPMAGGDPNATGGGMPQQDPMAGGDPNAMGGGMPQQDQIDGSELAPDAGSEENEDPMADQMGETGDDTTPGDGDDVVDITQLTDAQESMAQEQGELGDQIEDVNSKLGMLMKVVDKFTKALDANDEKLKDLQRELVKRNPTDEETMNVRVHAGGNPFDQKPEEFWERFKDINNHYNITMNNDAPQYHIKKGDIDNYNEHMVADEFDEIPGSLHDYFVK